MSPQYSFIAQGQIWVSPQVLEWEVIESTGGWGETRSEWRRSYQSWAHADRLIQVHDDENYLSDAMVRLHRVVDYRVKRLNELYKFQRIPIKDKPAQLWELLNYLGIIRPRMFAQLKEVRRGIEHFNKDSPPQDRCAELSEFVWYFLKCTDGLIEVTEFFGFKDVSSPHALSITGGPDQEWCFNIHGNVPLDFISASQERGWLEVKDAEAIGPNNHFGHGGVIIFQGTIADSSGLMRRLIEVYFQVRG